MQVDSAQGAGDVTPRQVKQALDEGRPVLLLDVRDPDEHEAWRIPGSVNVPLGDLARGAPLEVPEGADVVAVCASGNRSAQAAALLARRGVRARNMRGGMMAWNGVYDALPVDGAPEGVEVVQLRRVGKGCLSYVVASGGEAAVIDPTADVDEYLGLAATRGWRVVKALDTHAHADHVSGGRALAEATGAQYVAPSEVGDAVPHVDAEDGMEVEVGAARLRVLHTPGHTPGSVTYLLGGLAFTGDTLFVESVGRPDLGQDPRPNAAVLWETLRGRLGALPDATRVLPGHVGDTFLERRLVAARLGDLRRDLPALSMAKEEFVAWVGRNALPKPQSFDLIKRVNQGLLRVDDPEDVREMEAGPNRCAVSG